MAIITRTIKGKHQMSEWQPIETAPAGEDVLLYWPSGAQRVGYFNGNGWLIDGMKFDFDCDPSYWMPLPDPPNVTKAQL